MIGSMRSELRKVFTTRLWWGLTLGMMVIAGLVSASFASSVGTEFGEEWSQQRSWPVVYLGGLNPLAGTLTALFPLCMGIILTTTETRHKTLSVTYWSTPQRWEVLVGKTFAAAVVGLVMGIAHVIASVIGGASVLSLAKDLPLHLTDTVVQQSLALSVLAIVVTTLLGLGFGTLLRHQIAAISIAVGFVFVGQTLLVYLFDALKWDRGDSFLPGYLTGFMLSPTRPVEGSTLFTDGAFTWSSATLIMIGYAAILAIGGYFFSTRRDVT